SIAKRKYSRTVKYKRGCANVLTQPLVELLYISAWASALLVLAVMGNAKASISGMSDRYRFPRFFFIYIHQLF
ncbi:hypothetical protein, partial [Bacteroides sp. RTP21281st1_F3_RTP21281_210402]|uniref:hypothetical protein n=1 Tax=Bacteroides sp. RTP21281st1_F3_RTP21281_210402 TaxID=3143204 RepID=UPI0034A42FB1